eukprot:3444765-Rhodomonas_salina.1
MPGTGIAYDATHSRRYTWYWQLSPTRNPVLRWRMLLPERQRIQGAYGSLPPIVLRGGYAMSGTEIAYAGRAVQSVRGEGGHVRCRFGTVPYHPMDLLRDVRQYAYGMLTAGSTTPRIVLRIRYAMSGSASANTDLGVACVRFGRCDHLRAEDASLSCLLMTSRVNDQAGGRKAAPRAVGMVRQRLRRRQKPSVGSRWQSYSERWRRQPGVWMVEMEM